MKLSQVGSVTLEVLRTTNELPKEAKAYVEFIEKQLGVKISMVSNGPGRHEILYR